MMEQFNNLDVSNLDECPAEETLDETIRISVSESLTPPGCRPGGLAADPRPARTARRRGTVWILTSSL